MRGKRTCVLSPQPSGRIIPAHAGQTKLGSLAFSLNSDHPRACGANSAFELVRRIGCGSSPRMRGKLVINAVVGQPRRIIPAHAGQTAFARTRGRHRPDHPRACGANTMGFGTHRPDLGSSPRMRGKLRLVHVLGYLIRIIPAHAGQTCSFSTRSR